MLQALSPTCMVSTPRLSHLHRSNCVLGTTLPGHKVGAAVHRQMQWSPRWQHQGRGQLKEDIVQYLGIKNTLSENQGSKHRHQVRLIGHLLPGAGQTTVLKPPAFTNTSGSCLSRCVLVLSPLKYFSNEMLTLSSSSYLFQVLVRKPFLP